MEIGEDEEFRYMGVNTEQKTGIRTILEISCKKKS